MQTEPVPIASTVSGVLRPTRPSRPSSTVLVALLTAAVLGPAGVVMVREKALNPLSSQGVAAPVAYAFAVGVVLVAVSLLVHRPWVAGLTVGAIAAWASTAVAAPLVGTPYGYGSMRGDTGRMSALATYFATTARPSDAADPSLPVEYPPLYPMVTGRIAAITGKQAWLLIGPMQILLVGLAVLAAFILWRRLVPLALAVPLSVAPWAGLAEPSKGNEILVLSVFVPLLLATFTSTPTRRPLHPLVAGVGFGIMVPLFPSYLMFGLVGIAMMLVRGWLVSDDRAAYVVRAVVVVLTAAVLSSWYLGPLLLAYAGGATEVVADLYRAPSLTDSQFVLFLSKSPFIAAIQVAGLAGILMFWRSCWWAAPLGLLAGGILVVKTLMLLRYTTPPGHSFMLIYTPYVVAYLFAAAGLLTLGEVARRAWPHLRALTDPPPRLVVVAGVAALCAVFAAPAYMDAWVVQPRGVADTVGAKEAGSVLPESSAGLAHTELLPTLEPPLYPWPVMAPGFPSKDVHRALKATARTDDPVVLSGDQRLFAFYWYPNWLPTDRTSANALAQWDTRLAWLRVAATSTNPAVLSQQLADAPFGPIDVLVLRRTRTGYNVSPNVSFPVSALTGPQFTATKRLPLGWAVFVRN